MMLFALLLLLPKEAWMSGSAMGTVAETYFTLSGDDGLRIHFARSEDESEYHGEKRDEIALALRPLANRVVTLVEELRKKEPWAGLLQKIPGQPVAGAEFKLRHFELPEYGPLLSEAQAKGPYDYITSFRHSPGKGRSFMVTLRFRLSGSVKPELLYELADGVFALRKCVAPAPGPRANPQGPRFNNHKCKKQVRKLKLVRAAFAEGLRKHGLSFEGGEHEGSLFTASLEGPRLCSVSVEYTLAGAHQWGRAKRLFIEAALAELKGAREWPGFPLDPKAEQASWRILVPEGY